MGVEGRDKAKELEAGASALSGQLGRTVQRLRKSYNLSFSELSLQSGVASRSSANRAQRDQPDAGDHLATGSGARRLDRAGAAERPRTSRSSKKSYAWRHADSRLRRRQMPPRHHRLDQDGGMVAMVRFHGGSRRRAESDAAPARLGRIAVDPSRANSSGGRAASVETAKAGETLRYRCDRPHVIRNVTAEARPRHDGVHPEGGGDGMSSLL